MPKKRITNRERVILTTVTKPSLHEVLREVVLFRNDMMAGFALLNGRMGDLDTRLSKIERRLNEQPQR